MAKGLKDFDWMRKDPDLESIRDDPRFKSLSGSWKKGPRHEWSHLEDAHEGWEECRARARLHRFPLRRGKAILEKIANRYGKGDIHIISRRTFLGQPRRHNVKTIPTEGGLHR